jgi:hypothetical protein
MTVLRWTVRARIASDALIAARLVPIALAATLLAHPDEVIE